MRGIRLWKKPSLVACVFGLLSMLAFASPQAWAQGCWTTVGSAVTVDEANLGVFAVNNSIVGFKSTVPVGTMTLYYNVVDEELLHGGKTAQMTVRFRDNNDASQVVVKLIRVNIATGVETVLLSFDSNLFPPPAPAFRTGTVSAAVGFDFTVNAYYLRVFMYKSGEGSNPQLQAVRVCRK